MTSRPQSKQALDVSKPGSIKNHRVNFSPKEKVFDASAMPERSRKAREEVLKTLTGRELLQKRPPWNPDTGAGQRPMPQRPLEAQLHDHDHTKYVYNYRAETLPVADRRTSSGLGSTNDTGFSCSLTTGRVSTLPRCKEIDVNPALEDMPKWDSTTQVDPQLMKARHETTMKKALECSSKRIATVGTSYVSPENIVVEQKRVSRRKKEEEAAEKARLTQLYGPNYEDVLERIRRRDEMVEKTKNSPEWMKRQRRVEVYTHTGTWEMNKSENIEAWSCCMSTVKESRGCQKSVQNLDHWQVQSM